MRFKVVAIGLLLGGCGTLARGAAEVVVFESDPPGAQVTSIERHDCGGPCPERDSRDTAAQPYAQTPAILGPSCVTPCSVSVPRNREYIVTFTKPGYETQTLVLGTTLTGGPEANPPGNVILAGVIGGMADIGTAAGFDHTPNPMKAVLTRRKR